MCIDRKDHINVSYSVRAHGWEGGARASALPFHMCAMCLNVYVRVGSLVKLSKTSCYTHKCAHALMAMILNSGYERR